MMDKYMLHRVLILQVGLARVGEVFTGKALPILQSGARPPPTELARLR